MSIEREMSTSNLVVALQKLAKNVSYYNPGFRRALLNEAARRLTEYRERERQDCHPFD